jgi:hypothetical protein
MKKRSDQSDVEKHLTRQQRAQSPVKPGEAFDYYDIE